MEQFNFKREHESFTLTISASVEKIFPLACPVEELKWIKDWAYNMIYFGSGRNENNCIFTENISASGIMGSEFSEPTYWITTLYNPYDHVIHWLLIRSSTVTKLEFSVKSLSLGESEVVWDMTITAIKEEANSAFDETIKNRMKLMMAFIGHSLKSYCETGTIFIFEK
jgi:hypothetical protein